MKRYFVVWSLLLSCVAALAETPCGWIIEWGYNVNHRSAEPIVAATNLVTIAEMDFTNATKIAAGGEHCLALNSEGKVVAWGFNHYGQTSVPCELAGVKDVAAGENHSLALKNDGTVAAWGDNRFDQTNLPADLTNVAAISAAWNYDLVLLSDGVLAKIGKYSKLPSGLTNIVAIAGSKTFSGKNIALKNDGTIVEWSNRGGPVDNAVLEISNVIAIAAGGGHSLALSKDGAVFGWGANANGQATGSPTTDFQHPTRGMVTIGGQPLKDISAISAGEALSMALKKDGTVIVWGDNRWHQTDVPAGLSNVVAIAAGANYCLAITTNAVVAEKFRASGPHN
jgi:alpha-tubulin suppressor-like RCC1 family protein